MSIYDYTTEPYKDDPKKIFPHWFPDSMDFVRIVKKKEGGRNEYRRRT